MFERAGFFGSITISTGATLTLTDCTGEGKLQGTGSGTGVTIDGGIFNLYGGTITGFVNGVQVGVHGAPKTGSTFTMYGGTITGNNADSSSGGGGGGVYVGEKSSFTMDGGTITGNTATGGNGGGIFIHYNAGSVAISNAIITGNKATATGNISYGHGGGIYSQGSLTISGSTVTGNTATYSGGGICGKQITLNDTTVTENYASNGNDVFSNKEGGTGHSLTVSGTVKTSYYANRAELLPIYVSGTLTEDSLISVSVYDGLKPDVDGKLTIAEPATGVTLDAKNFKAGATDCVTGLDTDGTVYLALCAHEMDSTGYTCSKCGVTLDARVGENAYYQTLAKAFDATKGDTVTLLRDVTLNANCSAASIYDTTLDLNGKSISGANYRVTVGGGNNAGTLTIKNCDANSGAQALNAKFLVYSNGKLAVDSSYTGDIECVELQAGGTLERLGGKIGELILGAAAASATSTDYNVTLWNGNASYCTSGKISLNSNADQTLTVADLLKTNHAKCELYGEKDGTWSAINKATKIAELNSYTAYRVQFQECVHQCSDESNPVCSVCGKALVVKATATAADGTAKTAYFTADSTLENGYVEAVQTLNNWSSEGCTDATLTPLCKMSSQLITGDIILTGKLTIDGGAYQIFNIVTVDKDADVTFRSGTYSSITVNGKASFNDGTYNGVKVAEGAEAVFNGGTYESQVRVYGKATMKEATTFTYTVEIYGTLNVEGGNFKRDVAVKPKGTMNVSGGSFTGVGSIGKVSYDYSTYGTISGGTFTKLSLGGEDCFLSNLLADNAAYYNKDDGTKVDGSNVYTLTNVTVQTHEHNVDESTGICSECLKQMTASLTIGSETSWYLTFAATIDAANAADGEKTIKLYQNVNGGNLAQYELTNGPVTLETGEKTIQNVKLIAKGIALEIKGTGGAGETGIWFCAIADGAGAMVTVSDSETVIYDITAQNGGKLLLSAGKYLYLKVADGDSSAELSGGTYNEITYEKTRAMSHREIF